MLRLVLIALLAPSLSSRGAEDVTVTLRATRDKAPLSQEAEKLLTEYIKKALQAKRDQQEAHLKEIIEQISKQTGIGDDVSKKLLEAAKPAIERSLEKWSEYCEIYIRPFAADAGERFVSQVDSWQVDGVARMVRVDNAKMPEDFPEWRDALKKTLSAEQVVKWDKLADGEKHGLERQILDALKPVREKYAESVKSRMETEIANIHATLKLPEERVKALNGVVDEVVKDAVAAWEQTMMNFFKVMPEQERQMMLARNADRDTVNFGTAQQPENRDLWKNKLKAILTEDESKRLEDESSHRKDQQAVTLARLALVLLDQQVGFTSQQRVKIEPLLVRHMTPLTKQRQDRGEWSSLSTTELLGAAGKVKAEELQPVLDAKQLPRWKDACDPKNTQRGSRRRNGAKPAEPPKAGEPADPDRLVSEYLFKAWSNLRGEAVNLMLVKVEDAQRVLLLPEDKVNRLRTAAKGAAEESLNNWRESAGEWVRSNLQNTRPQDVRAQLNGMLEDVGFGRNPSPWDCSIWINAIKETLDEEQTKKWKAEQDARQEYRTHAVIGSVLYELDHRYRVSAAQMQQLEPMLKKVLADYEEDIRDYFSFDNGGWFLMSYYALLPVAGLEEKDAKSVFTAAQWKQWEAQDFPRLGNYWSNLKQNHENRMGRQKR